MLFRPQALLTPSNAMLWLHSHLYHSGICLDTEENHAISSARRLRGTAACTKQLSIVLEEDTRKVWSFYQNSLGFLSIDKDMKRLIERVVLRSCVFKVFLAFFWSIYRRILRSSIQYK